MMQSTWVVAWENGKVAGTNAMNGTNKMPPKGLSVNGTWVISTIK